MKMKFHHWLLNKMKKTVLYSVIDEALKSQGHDNYRVRSIDHRNKTTINEDGELEDIEFFDVKVEILNPVQHITLEIKPAKDGL